MFYKSGKLAKRLTTSLCIGVFFVLLAVSFLQIYMAISRGEEQLNNNLKQYALMAAPTFSQPLWNVDIPQVNLNIEAITKGNYVYGATILDDKGVEIASIGNRIRKGVLTCETNISINDAKKSFSKNKCLSEKSKLITERQRITYDNQLVGSIIIYGNKDNAIELMIPIIAATGFSTIIILISLIIVLLLLIEKQIGNPIRIFTESIAAHALSSKEKDITLNINLINRDDELGELSRSFESMIERLAKYQNHLEDIVNERTEKLRIANSAKSEFLSHMSHEIRTPINGVLGLSEIILNKTKDQDTKEQIKMIYDSGSHLLKIVNDILDLSKIEAGKLDLEIISFDIRLLIEEINNLFSNYEKSENVDFIISIDKSISKYVFGDPFRLKQILINLISNAFKFTKFGQISLILKSSEADFIEFSVADTGIGISEEKIKKLFKAFEQLDKSTTRIYGGTGLGLTICKELIQLMGGEIHVSSTENKGSIFRFTINLPVSDTPDTEKNDLIFLAENNKSLNVLVAEDNAVNQAVIKGMLAKFNIQPVIIENGEEVLNRVCSNDIHFDVIFMDCEMPVMDGWEASKKIREYHITDKSNNPVLIIGLSAHAIEGANKRAIEAGMNDYLTKPLSLEKLSAMLRKNNLID